MAFAVQYVSTAFFACWSWLREVFDSLGAVPYYVAALSIFMFIQAVLLPLRGGRMFSLGSDIAGAIKRSEGSKSRSGSSDNGKGSQS